MNATMQGALRSKTMWFAVALAIGGVLADNIDTLKPYLGTYGGIAGVVIAVIMAALRVVSVSSLADKAPSKDDGSDSGA